MKINIERLRKLIKQGESQKLEFKKSTAQLQAAFETICAFLNDDGGTVLIGVNDSGGIIGQNITDNTRQEIARSLSKIEPPPQAKIDIQYIPIKDDKHAVAIQVRSMGHAPYIFDGRAFQRNQSTTSRMPQHRYEQLLVERGQLNHSWEEFIAKGYDINSLDHGEIRRTIQDGIKNNRLPPDAINDSIEATLIRLQLLDTGKLKNAAVVLFAKELFPAYAQCMIKMARFRGISHTGDFIDNQQVYGNIFKILSDADNFIRRHFPIASFFNPDQFERIDKPILPVLAVREAMVNAVCHRDYTNRVASITLAIYDDRMEIWNNGTLPATLQLNDLKKRHGSFPRNKIIANVLYCRKFFEKWGSGTNKMIDYCREDGVPEPKFEEYSGGLAVIFRFKEPIGMTIKKIPVAVSLNSRQEEILSIIKKHNIINIQQIMSDLVNPPSERMIKKDLNSMKKMGLIVLQGSKRGSLWLLNEDRKA